MTVQLANGRNTTKDIIKNSQSQVFGLGRGARKQRRQREKSEQREKSKQGNRASRGSRGVGEQG